MKRIPVAFQREDVIEFIIDDDPEMNWIGEFEDKDYNRIFVFIDRNVRATWGALIEERLKAHGKEIFWLEIEPVEASKSLDFYPTAVDFIQDQGGNRYDLVIAIGGGIVIDLASFVVSTYMRGLPFYVIATTVIGQIDATTAGKTCLNTGQAKNVLGTFFYPLTVYNNICFLDTNAERYSRQGYSEVFKYGLLGSAELIAKYKQYREEPNGERLKEVIELSIQTRAAIRRIDPLASNLGHTFGHAIEKVSDYTILHGDAISAGTVMALRFAQQLDLITAEAVEGIIATMRTMNLNVYHDTALNAAELARLMLKDKKSSVNTMHLVLIRGIDSPYIGDGGSPFYRAQPADVEAFLDTFFANGEFALDDCAAFLDRDWLYK